MDNLVASRWRRLPIMGAELCPGLWVRFPEDYHRATGIPSTHWALVQTVLHWPSDKLPDSYVFSEDDVPKLMAARMEASAAYSFIELEWDAGGMPLDLEVVGVVNEVGNRQTRSKWFMVAKMQEMLVLARADRYGRPEVGVWPQPLDAGRDGGDQESGDQMALKLPAGYSWSSEGWDWESSAQEDH